jgi:diguanylate cyclase (GGDEF)-like protein/PAS domain S-box-containing protein
MDKELILVIDDNPQISDFLVHKLLPSMGFEAVPALNGASALEIVDKYPFSLLLVDLQLPDTTGLELLAKMKARGVQLPSILATAHGSEQIAAEAFRLGVQDYLTKPVDVDNLSNAITRALSISRLNRENSQLTNRLKQQVEWLKVLINVGKSVTSTLELNEVLRRIVEAGVYLTHAEEGFIALLDENNDKLYLRAAKNIDEKKITTMRLPVTDSLLGAVISSGVPYRSSNRKEDTQIMVSTGFLVHSLLHVPLISKGKPLGVLTVDNRKSRRDFSEFDETILLSLADYATVALENASLYEQAEEEIAERAKVEKALRISDERYELAIKGANDGLWDWDLKENRIYYSPRWKSMLGFNEDEIDTNPDEWFNRIHPDDLKSTKLDITNHLKGVTPHFENEHRILHKDGNFRWMLSRGIAVTNGDNFAVRMAGSQSDITARKDAEAKLLHDAFYDPLTNLPNRALFMDHLKFAVERSKRKDDYLFAVLFLDLDRFKDINDSFGHLIGDDFLIRIAEILKTGRRSTDTVARLGGDEFVILLDDINDEEDARVVAKQIQQELAKPIDFSGKRVFVTTSIGIVMGSTGYLQSDDVLRDADIAMYSAKANGRNRFEIFDPSMRESIMRRLALETELRHALENNELRVYYQPIVSLEGGQLVGFEALVRWLHPQHGLLPPLEFIPLAEETGMVILVDRYVMREACLQMKKWHEEIPFDPPLSISVNISALHINQPDFVEEVSKILAETGLEPHRLKIEITENTIMNNIESTNEVFSELQDLGVQIQIDDFGVGYSSLSYLSNFPINALKIDQTFVGLMTEDNTQLKIVQAIVMLTHRLGVGVIAEGVETEGQLVQLQEIGCGFGQGYLVSIPLNNEGVKTLLTQLNSSEEQKLPPWGDQEVVKITE